MLRADLGNRCAADGGYHPPRGQGFWHPASVQRQGLQAMRDAQTVVQAARAVGAAYWQSRDLGGPMRGLTEALAQFDGRQDDDETDHRLKATSGSPGNRARGRRAGAAASGGTADVGA